MTEKKSVTIVCCYNQKSLFQDLLNSIVETNTDWNIFVFPVDNSDRRFSSCAAAFNYALASIDTEYVIFSHQDILLYKEGNLKRYLDQLSQVGDQGILGVAGVLNKKRGIYSNCYKNLTLDSVGNIPISELQECDTLDECFFGGKTELFRTLPFDETTCNGWHLYAVDRCLDFKRNGLKVFVSNVDFIHPSDGKIDQAFIKTFLALSKKYDKDYKIIRSCCASCGTGFFGRLVGYLKLQRVFLMRR